MMKTITKKKVPFVCTGYWHDNAWKMPAAAKQMFCPVCGQYIKREAPPQLELF